MGGRGGIWAALQSMRWSSSGTVRMVIFQCPLAQDSYKRWRECGKEMKGTCASGKASRDKLSGAFTTSRRRLHKVLGWPQRMEPKHVAAKGTK